MQAFDLSLSFHDHSLLLWRRMTVPLNWNFDQLGKFLTLILNYSGDASFEFIFPEAKERITNDETLLEDAAFLKSDAGKAYLKANQEKDFPVDMSVTVLDVQKTPLVAKLDENVRFLFLYDFIDEWTYQVTVRAVGIDEAAPRLLDGQGTAPFEASGGLDSFDEMMTIITDPNHVAYDEIRAWMEKQALKLFDLTDTQREVERQKNMGLL